MKKIFLSPILLALIPLTGCGLNSSFSVSSKDQEKTQFVLASKLVDSIPSKNNAVLAKYLVASSDPLKDVLPLVEQADFILGQGKNSVSSVKSDSDLEGYETKETIEYKDVDGVNKEVTLYYNSSIKEEKEADEIEAEETMIGVMKTNEFEYPFIAKNEIENEKDELEASYEITIKTSNDSYLVSKWSIEEENENNVNKKEEQYSYKVVENGRTVKEYSYEFEAYSNNVKKIELQYNNVEYELSYYSKDGKDFLLLEIEDEAADQETSYLYSKAVDESGNINYILVE